MVSEPEATTGDRGDHVTTDRLAVSLAEIGREFANVRADIAERDAAIASLGGKIDTLGAELRGEISAQGAELRGEIRALGAELRGEISAQGATLRGEISAQANRLLMRIGGLLGVVLVLDQLLSRI